MTSTELPLATAEQVDQIQENLIAYFRIFATLPDVTLVEDELKWVVSKGMPGNFVLRTQLPSDGLDQRIDHLVSQIGQSANQFDWFVFPSCQPVDLGERIAARGLAGGPDGNWQLVGTVGGPGGTWMLADLTNPLNPPQGSERFRIEQVTNHHQLETWSRATIAGFGHDAHHLDNLAEHPFHAAYARHGFGEDARSLHYIGYLNDQPVTSSTLLLAGGIAGLFDISTPVAFRRQGFGSAISWWMLYEAQRRGYRQAYVWSSNLGRNVYRSVGFIPHNIGMREYSWEKR
jgi:ribosomal protein S18 acetylase RimI-like enzyme